MRLFIAAGYVQFAGAAVANVSVRPAAVWVDWLAGAARPDACSRRTAVPAGAAEFHAAVTAAERVGRPDGMQDAVAAHPVATVGRAERRDEIRDTLRPRFRPGRSIGRTLWTGGRAFRPNIGTTRTRCRMVGP